MKKFLFLIAVVTMFATINSYSYIVTQLGQGWKISGGYDVAGKVVGGNLYINSNTMETATRAWVYCDGNGYCMRISGGFIDIDLVPLEEIIIIPNSTPDISQTNLKSSDKQGNNNLNKSKDGLESK